MSKEILGKYTISYAQNREDIIIDAFFPDVKKGFYVDIGANHPYYHSVTKRFYDKGWTGINFEPNPKLYDQIKEHRPLDTNIMEGVGSKEGSLTLRIYHSRDGLEGISTFSKTMKKEYLKDISEDNKNSTDIQVRVKTLKKTFDSSGVKHVNFMKVDVEGFEYEVLAGNDWDTYRPELLCIEANHVYKDWRNMLKKANYEKVFNDGLNDYYLAKESIHRTEYFDYAKTFLLDKPVIGHGEAEEIRIAVEGKKNAETQLKAYMKERESLLKRIKEMDSFIQEITPLTKHFKRQVKARVKRS